MGEAPLEKRLDRELKTLGTNQEELGEALAGAEAVVEQISEMVGEQGQGDSDEADATTHPVVHTFSISDRIASLLAPKAKPVQLPPLDTQRKKVEKHIKQEINHLLKKAKKIENSKHFSAHALERVIGEIRLLRGLLKEMASAVAHRIEQLYRRFIMKRG